MSLAFSNYIKISLLQLLILFVEKLIQGKDGFEDEELAYRLAFVLPVLSPRETFVATNEVIQNF